MRDYNENEEIISKMNNLDHLISLNNLLEESILIIFFQFLNALKNLELLPTQ